MTTTGAVLIIYTGGTIGMVTDPESGVLRPFDFNHLYQQVPELKQFNCKLEVRSFEEPIDSSNMTPAIWAELALLIQANYDEYDGFVVLHGSDTMAYTASALSFMLEDLNKPVILTGSQLPIGVIRTDGKENLITAIEIASTKEKGKPLVPEVAIYFEYKLYRGNRTFKASAEHFEAFESPNYPLLADAGLEINYNRDAIKKTPPRSLVVHTTLNTNITILKHFPGINVAVVDAILSAPGLEAAVIETFGSGNASTDPAFLGALKRAADKGIVLLNTTQCNKGAVRQGRHETSANLAMIGMVNGYDLTLEAAVTKLMFLLGQGLSKEEVKKALVKSICGEMTSTASN